MELYELRQMQSLPLEAKIIKSQLRIREWYEYWDGNVYVSFSGGKDSTVLLHLVRGMYPHVPAVFCDSELEYPEIRKFVRQTENVIRLRPRWSLKHIIEKHGYPVISKEQARYIEEIRRSSNDKSIRIRLYGDGKGRFCISQKWQHLIAAPFKISDQCCYNFKKGPTRKYEIETGNKPFLGIMASESNQRKTQFLRHSCNNYNAARPRSNPLSFWLEEDIWEYLHRFNVPYSKIYDMGYTRTGCMFCMFGIHLEGHPNRFEKMKKTHPKQWSYCINKLGVGQVLDYIGIEYGKHEQVSIFDS